MNGQVERTEAKAEAKATLSLHRILSLYLILLLMLFFHFKCTESLLASIKYKHSPLTPFNNSIISSNYILTNNKGKELDRGQWKC